MYEVRGTVASKLFFHGAGRFGHGRRQLMSRMKIIAMDTHCEFCEGGFINGSGKELGTFRVATCIPALVEAIEKVPRPRKLVIEEGPLADWLSRSLSPYVDEMVVCDPQRNALIAKEGEKSDPIDWRKLAQLCRGGYIRAVHHAATLERSVLRQHVQLYHERVSRRVSEGHKIIWRARGFGLIVKHKDLSDPARRKQMLEQLPANQTVRQDMRLLLEGFDLLDEQVKKLRSRLLELSKGEPMVRRFCRVKGVKHVRAATFVAIVDTPFRFKTKQKLWKYMGTRKASPPSRVGEASERQRTGEAVGAPALQPDSEKRDSRRGQVGDRVEEQCLRRPVPKVAGCRVLAPDRQTQRGSEPGGGDVGHVEERQRVR
jgi:hypothetical protein